MITGPKSERRKGASKGRSSFGQESHWVQLLSGVALQVKEHKKKEEHFLPHASKHCMWALPGNATQPLAGLGPLGKSIDKSYPDSTTFWPWEQMG